MASLIISIIVTAALSSILTLALASFIFDRKVKPQLLKYIKDELLPEFREQVKNGGKDAGEELLPAFRKSVNHGFQDALRETTGANAVGEAVGETAKTMAKTFETGMDVLLGKR